jgi:hypothetical protein
MVARFAQREWHEEETRMNIRNGGMEKSKMQSKEEYRKAGNYIKPEEYIKE